MTEPVTLLVNGKDEIVVTPGAGGKANFSYVLKTDPLTPVTQTAVDTLSKDDAFLKRATDKLAEDGYVVDAQTFKTSVVKFTMKDPDSNCEITNGEKYLEKQIFFITAMNSTPNYRKILTPQVLNDIKVDCKQGLAMGGTVTGQTGAFVVSAGDISVNVAADATSYKLEGLAVGAAQTVTVSTQPTGQTCTVAATGTTTSLEDNVTDANITCVTNSAAFTLGGTVSGLGEGKSVKLRDFDQPLATKYATVTANGPWQFPGTRALNYQYQVDVILNPEGQHCRSTNDFDTVQGNVTNIEVECAYSVGGTVSGLSMPGNSVVLELTYGAMNTKDTVTLESGMTTFDFPADLAVDDAYSVVVQSAMGVTCSAVTGGTNMDGTGTISNSETPNILVECSSL